MKEGDIYYHPKKNILCVIVIRNSMYAMLDFGDWHFPIFLGMVECYGFIKIGEL
jgi:hypothetical protein